MSNSLTDIYGRARAHHKAGRLEQAAADYKRVLQVAPEHAPSLQFLGLTAHQLGDHEQAVALISKAIRLDSSKALYFNNVGIALQSLEKLDEAEEAFRRAIELDHDYAGALYNLAMLLLAREDLDEAETLARRAVELKPQFEDAAIGLAQISTAQGRAEEAESILREVTRTNPNAAGAWAHLAGLKMLFGHIDEAVELLRLALRIDSDHELALMYLGTALRSLGSNKAATACFRRLVKLKPKAAMAWVNLASLEDEANHYENALSAYRYAASVNPNLKAKVACHLALLFLKACDWDMYADREEHLITYVKEHLEADTFDDLAPLSLNYFGIPVELRRRAAELRATIAEKTVRVSKRRCEFEHRRVDVDRIKIGYVSPDFRTHAVGTLIRDLFAHHDRSAFEVFAYGLVPSDDEVNQTVRAGVDHYLDISTWSHEAAARKIYEDGIHILIDLAGYTTHSKTEIFALQPAPVQAHYMGYLDTMGADFLPYMIADEIAVTPEMAASFSETVVYVPTPFFVTSRMADSGAQFDRADFGLPEEGFVFCCMNNQRKINPEVFEAWTRILNAVPESVLWLYDRDQVGGRNNLKTAAENHGLNPDRLVFADSVSHGDYIARYRLADLFLDTFVYSAGATAVGALQAGVPVLTRPGNTMLNRMGASIVVGAGLPDLVASDTDDYVRKAVDLAYDPSELGRMRDHLLTNRDSIALFDTARWVKDFEVTLTNMWESR